MDVILGIHHYRTRLLCRVPETLGKGRKTLGKEIAECSTRRSAHGLSSTGENGNAECLFSSTRQIFAVCHAALGKKMKRDGRTANGTDGTGWERNFAECWTRGTQQRSKVRRVPDIQHSAKFRSSPSATLLALGEVSITLGKYVFQEIEKWLLCRVSG